MKIEYRLRPVTRYIVTRYAEGDGWTDEDKNIGSSERGEFDNAETAYEVAYALCRAEHEKLGYQPADERVQYPRRIDSQKLGENKQVFKSNPVQLLGKKGLAWIA